MSNRPKYPITFSALLCRINELIQQYNLKSVPEEPKGTPEAFPLGYKIYLDCESNEKLLRRGAGFIALRPIHREN